jgi:8-oxo-dGTP pyrophosphatase MutT (NUDIX family)
MQKQKRNEHAWAFPQGGMEPADKTLRDCAVREFTEECGSDV